jgi:hypothetical protein
MAKKRGASLGKGNQQLMKSPSNLCPKRAGKGR